jgi:hypothetical protein
LYEAHKKKVLLSIYLMADETVCLEADVKHLHAVQLMVEVPP